MMRISCPSSLILIHYQTKHQRLMMEKLSQKMRAEETKNINDSKGAKDDSEVQDPKPQHLSIDEVILNGTTREQLEEEM